MPKQENEKVLFQVPMLGGMDQSSQDTVAKPNSLTTLENFWVNRNGSYEIRPGFERLSGSLSHDFSSTTSITDVFAARGKMLGMDVGNVCKWSETSQTWWKGDPKSEIQIRPIERAQAANLGMIEELVDGTVVTGKAQIAQCDVIQLGDIRVTAWVEKSTSVTFPSVNAEVTKVCVRVEDLATGFCSDVARSGNYHDSVRLLRYVGIIGGVTVKRIYVISGVSNVDSTSATDSYVEGKYIDCTNIAAGFSSPMIIGAKLAQHPLCGSNPIWEATVVGNRVVIIYNKCQTAGGPSGGGTVYGTIVSLDANLLNPGELDTAYTAYTHWALCGRADLDKLYVIYNDGSSTPAWINSMCVTLSTLTVAWTPHTIDQTSDIINVDATTNLERIGLCSMGSNVRVVYSLMGQQTDNYCEPQVRVLDFSTTDYRPTAASRTYNVTLLSQPVYANSGKCYALIALAEKSWHLYDLAVKTTSGDQIASRLPRLQGHSYVVDLETQSPQYDPSGNMYTLMSSSYEPARVASRVLPYETACYDAGSTDSLVRPISMTLMSGSLWDNYPHNGSLQQETYVTALPTMIEGTAPVVNTPYVPELSVDFSVATLDVNPLGHMNAVDVGNKTLFAGGVPMQWDGNRLVEVGWNNYPRLSNLQQIIGGGLATTGSYTYVALYSWVDKLGDYHWSEPSTPLSVLLTARMGSITIDVDALTLTQRENSNHDTENVAIELYRTLDSGTEYYYVSSLKNERQRPIVTFTDTLGDHTDNALDDALDKHSLIPNRGGSFSAGCTPALKGVCCHDGRPFGIVAHDPTQVAFGQYVSKGEAIKFPDGWVLESVNGCGYTALGSMGEKIVAFQRNSIDAFFGSGPNDTGAGSSYSDPRKVCETAGAVDHRGVVRHPTGFLFKSDNTVMSIDEGFGVTDIGFAAQDLFDMNSVVLSAVADTTRNQIVMSTLSPIPTQISGHTTYTYGSKLLVWNWARGCWSTWSLPPAITCTFGLTFAADGRATTPYNMQKDVVPQYKANVFSDAVGSLAPQKRCLHIVCQQLSDLSNVVVRERDANVLTDNYTMPSMSATYYKRYVDDVNGTNLFKTAMLETPWLSVSGMQALTNNWRLSILGKACGDMLAGQVTVQGFIYYDFDDSSAKQTCTLQPLPAIGNSQHWQGAFNLMKTENQSIKLLLEFSAFGSIPPNPPFLAGRATTGHFNIEAITLEAATGNKLALIPAAVTA